MARVTISVVERLFGTHCPHWLHLDDDHDLCVHCNDAIWDAHSGTRGCVVYKSTITQPLHLDMLLSRSRSCRVTWIAATAAGSILGMSLISSRAGLPT